jgi:purine-cytosine permease-like protein
VAVVGCLGRAGRPVRREAALLLFAVLMARICQHHIALPRDTVHGGALAGAFALMVTITVSQVISWATYASDFGGSVRFEPA